MDEEFFNKEMPKIAPPATHIRAVSLPFILNSIASHQLHVLPIICVFLGILTVFVSKQESLSLMDVIDSAPPVVAFEKSMSSKNIDSGTDLFSLLYVTEETQDRTVVPPSRWATFECKNYLWSIFFNRLPDLRVLAK